VADVTTALSTHSGPVADKQRELAEMPGPSNPQMGFNSLFYIHFGSRVIETFHELAMSQQCTSILMCNRCECVLLCYQECSDQKYHERTSFLRHHNLFQQSRGASSFSPTTASLRFASLKCSVATTTTNGNNGYDEGRRRTTKDDEGRRRTTKDDEGRRRRRRRRRRQR